MDIWEGNDNNSCSSNGSRGIFEGGELLEALEPFIRSSSPSTPFSWSFPCFPLQTCTNVSVLHQEDCSAPNSHLFPQGYSVQTHDQVLHQEDCSAPDSHLFPKRYSGSVQTHDQVGIDQPGSFGLQRISTPENHQIPAQAAAEGKRVRKKPVKKQAADNADLSYNVDKVDRSSEANESGLDRVANCNQFF
ncbi:hypothetical protein ACET3Z_008812 [Daucus carota]